MQNKEGREQLDEDLDLWGENKLILGLSDCQGVRLHPSPRVTRREASLRGGPARAKPWPWPSATGGFHRGHLEVVCMCLSDPTCCLGIGNRRRSHAGS